MNPNVSISHSYLGLMYILPQQRLAEARKPLDQALSIDPDNYHANFHRGLYYRLSGFPDSALS